MDDTTLHFARPIWLYAGVVVCAGVAALYWRFDRRRDADLAKWMHPRFRQRLTVGYSPRLRKLKRGLWLAAMMLLFAAVAGPRMGYEWREVKRKGIDILFAVDTSRSMLAEDLSPNRLERARLGILDFVDRLEGDRIGLIPFAGSAFALCPLTLDYDAFRESLNALDTDLIPRQGTDLATAIAEAERLFDENGNNHRVLVLLTDGEDLQGSVIKSAEDAAKKGMAIYTVGVGSSEGAQIPVPLRNGRTDFVRDEAGQIVKTALDETTLKKIAEATGGLYVPLGRGAEGLDTIYKEKLRLVPKSELSQNMQKVPLERFEYPLGAALLLLLLEYIMSDRARAKPGKQVLSVARRMPGAATALLLLGLMAGAQSIGAKDLPPPDRRLDYNQGTEAYGKGDFAKASESLRTSLKTPDLTLQERSYYNLGNTLYRTGQASMEKDPEATIKNWEESIKAYQDALALDDGDDDARYNKALVEKKLEELKKKQEEQKDQKSDDKKQDDKKDQKDNKDSKDSKDGEKKENQESRDQKPEDKKQGDQKDSKDQDSKDGQKNDDKKENQKSGDQKPDDKKQEDQKSEGAKDGEKKDSADSKKSDDKKDGQENKDKKENPETRDQKPEDKKSEDQKDSKEGKQADASKEKSGDPKKDGKDQPAADINKDGKEQGTMSNERAQRKEMTPEEAKQLLEALKIDERTVIPIEPQRRSRYLTPDNSVKGKTW